MKELDILPAHETIYIIIAVVYFQVISHAGGIILKVKVKKLDFDPLAVLHSYVPITDLVIFIFLWVPGGFKNMF